MKKLIKLIPIIFLCLVPLIWFYGRSGFLINGVDTNFPLDPFQWFVRRLFVWNDVFNTGSDFSSSISGIFFHFIQLIPYQIGLNLQLVEIFSLTFWFSAIILSAYFYARVLFPNYWLIQILFVVLYAFNTYIFNSWENVKVSNLSLIASLPAALAVLTKLQGNLLSLSTVTLYGVLIGIILSGAGINPSYFFAFFLILSIYFLAQLFINRSNKFNLSFIKKTVLFLGIILIVNTFWIIPTVTFLSSTISPTNSIDKLGLTNWIDSLSEHTSLLNIMRLQGAWDWYAVDGVTGAPIYIPYALNYFYNWPFILFSFLLPALALASFFKVDLQRKFLYLAFGLMMLLGIFLGSGTHLPSGHFYRVLIDHLPFFTIFRSPWYIFTPMLLLSYAGLVSLLLFNLLKLKRYTLLVYLAVLVIIVGNLIYSYPLITGKIFRPTRPDSFYINFPQYIFEAKHWIDSNNYGRIITYPNDEIEQFSWGYRGIESILSLLSNKEILYSSLSATDAPISRLIKEFYESLAKGEIELADNLSFKMGSGVIFEKKDQKSLSSKLPVEVTQMTLASFGQWYFYKFPKDSTPTKLQSVNKIFLGFPYTLESRMVGVIGKDALLVNPDDKVIKDVKKLADLSNSAIKAENSQSTELTKFSNSVSQLNDRLLSRDMSRVSFDFNIPKEAIYKPILDKYKLEDFGLNITTIKSIELELDSTKSSWEIDKVTDSFVYFKPLKLTKGIHKLVMNLDNKNLIKGGDFESHVEFEQKSGGIINIESSGIGHLLSILNKNFGAPETSADFNVPTFDPLASYYIETKYQQIYGNNASMIVYQYTPSTLIKAQTERLPNYPQMNTFSFYYEPVKTDSGMKISLIAPFIADPLGTKVLYDDLKVIKVFKNQMFFTEVDQSKVLSSIKTKIQKISPVLYDVEVEGGSVGHILSFAENYSPEWILSIYDKNGKKLDIKPVHFSGNLFANAWYIENAPDKYTAKIYYQRQNLLILGFIISGLVIFLGLILGILKLFRKQ